MYLQATSFVFQQYNTPTQPHKWYSFQQPHHSNNNNNKVTWGEALHFPGWTKTNQRCHGTIMNRENSIEDNTILETDTIPLIYHTDTTLILLPTYKAESGMCSCHNITPQDTMYRVYTYSAHHCNVQRQNTLPIQWHASRNPGVKCSV